MSVQDERSENLKQNYSGLVCLLGDLLDSTRASVAMTRRCSAYRKCKVKGLTFFLLTLVPWLDSTNYPTKYMKTPPSFSRTRFFSFVRITSASVLLTAAAAMAFVAVKPSGPSWAKSDSKSAINKFNQNRAQLFRNKIAMPGPEQDGGPTAAAEEAYANRAYPAAYVPFALTRNAHRAWANVMARAPGRGVNPLGGWTLAGPSTANFPDVLTFSGAAYTTSGRITALAIDPSCSHAEVPRLGGSSRRRGLANGQGTFRQWGFLDIYFRQLRDKCDRDVDLRRGA